MKKVGGRLSLLVVAVAAERHPPSQGRPALPHHSSKGADGKRRHNLFGLEIWQQWLRRVCAISSVAADQKPCF